MAGGLLRLRFMIKRAVEWAAMGLLVGGVAGPLILLLLVELLLSEEDEGMVTNVGYEAFAAAVLGGVVGAVIGAAAGTVWHLRRGDGTK